MSIDSILPVQAITDVAKAEQSASIKQADFADWISQQISETDGHVKNAENQVQQLALGEADNLHQVMIALSKAKTSFELTVQVRNRLLEGFQQVMRMNV